MKLKAGLVVILCGFGLAACGGTRPIGQVLADPSQYSNKDVRVEGQVIQSYSVVGQGAYRIEDATGRLWVVSQEGVPSQGAHVSVKGRVRQAYNLAGIIDLPGPLGDGVVMFESSHETR
jgi:hypothetical protein